MRPKSASEIEAMRRGGQMLAQVLNMLKQELAVGMTTQELSDKAEAELRRLGGQPAFKGYQGFPAALCTSINQEIVHGIPSAKRRIAEGDVVKLDFGVRYKGLITDSAITVIAGGKTPEKAVTQLVEATERSLYAGIDAIKGEGTHLGDIGAAVQAVLDKAGLGIIRELVGHGVGDGIHEDPNVANYGAKGSGQMLRAGMTIAIEPMAALGDWAINILPNGVVEMKDGSIGAHFEHTVVITENGAEILTQP